MSQLEGSCPNCGANVSASAKFCGKCGNAISRERACPHCHAAVSATAKFCRTCGKPITAVVGQAAPQAREAVPARPPATIAPSAPSAAPGQRRPVIGIALPGAKSKNAKLLAIGSLAALCVCLTFGLTGSIYLLSSAGVLPIEPPVFLTTLVSQRLGPSDAPATVSYKDQVRVTVPGSLLKTEETLTISSVIGGRPVELPVKKQTLATYDIKLGELHQFDTPLVIELGLEALGASAKQDEASGYEVAYWDAIAAQWVSMPFKLDSKSHTLIVPTRHLSRVSVELIFADGYIANEYFTLHYNKQDIQKSASYPHYENQADPNANTFPQNPEPIPPFVLDTWYYLNHARMAYEDARGSNGTTSLKYLEVFTSTLSLKTPASVPVFDPKVNPGYYTYNVYVGGAGNPQTSKIGGIISIPADPPEPWTRPQLRFVVAHEVFHAVQSRYYSWVGKTTMNWWMDATAEYAAGRIALPGSTMGEPKELPLFLTMALDYTPSDVGEIMRSWFSSESPQGRHKYNASYFIDYLVKQKGVNFVDLWNWMADNCTLDVLSCLENYAATTQKVTLGDYYRDFAYDFVFNYDSPMPSPDKTKSSIPLNATKKDWLKWGPGVVSNKFSLESYTASLWSVEVGNPASKERRNVSVWATSPLPPGVTVYVTKLQGLERIQGSYPPTEKIESAKPLQPTPGSPISILGVGGSDYLHILVVNGLGKRLTQDIELRVGTIELTGRLLWREGEPAGGLAPSLVGWNGSCKEVSDSGSVADDRTIGDGKFIIKEAPPIAGDNVVRAYTKMQDDPYWDVPVTIDWLKASKSIDLGDLILERLSMEPKAVKGDLGRYHFQATANDIQSVTKKIRWEWNVNGSYVDKTGLQTINEQPRQFQKDSGVQVNETDSLDFDFRNPRVSHYDVLVDLYDVTCGKRWINRGRVEAYVTAASSIEAPYEASPIVPTTAPTEQEAPAQAGTTALATPSVAPPATVAAPTDTTVPPSATPIPTVPAPTDTPVPPSATPIPTVPVPADTPVPPPVGNGSYSPITFAAGATSGFKPMDPMIHFPEGVRQIFGVYTYSGMTDGTPYRDEWYLNGALFKTTSGNWELGEWGNAESDVWRNNGLPVGEWELRMYIGDSLVQRGSCTVDARPAGAPFFGPIRFAEGVTADNQPISVHGADQHFQQGIKKIYGLFDAGNMTQGLPWKTEWHYNGTKDYTPTGHSWNGGATGVNLWSSFFGADNGQQPIGYGTYELKLYISDRLVQLGTFVVDR